MVDVLEKVAIDPFVDRGRDPVRIDDKYGNVRPAARGRSGARTEGVRYSKPWKRDGGGRRTHQKITSIHT